MSEPPWPAPTTRSGRIACPVGCADHLRARTTRILVTGAGGWLGRATLELLEDVFGDALADRVIAFGATQRDYELRSGRHLPIHALASLADVPKSPSETLVAHYAFLTREKANVGDPASYLATNGWLTAFVVEQCRRLGASGTFSTSSGAVYRSDRTLDTDIDANPYGAQKVEEEAAFARLRAETGCSSAICRVFNLGGPFINKDYALSSFLRDALAGRDIQVAARRPVLRSYAHVGDVVSAGIAAMSGLIEPPDEPYDTAGDEVVEVGGLAARIYAVLGIDGSVRRPEYANRSEEAHVYVGDGRQFRQLVASLGQEPMGLDRQILDTAAFLKATSP